MVLVENQADVTSDGTCPVALMDRETRLRFAPLTPELDGVTLAPGKHLLRGDRLLLHAESGVVMLYRKGEGITVHRTGKTDEAEESLWLNGTVYAAIASINGLYPVHASAVAHDGQVHAFTGPAGAGKSTLTAELGRRGLPMFCDDTLILDLRDPARIMCLPGHKRLKLWPDALELTGAAQDEEVLPGWGKFYARPHGEPVRTMLPLASLTFLEEGPAAAIETIGGGARIARLMDDHYTADLYLEASQADKAQHFALLARLAQAIAVQRFVRPRDRSRFTADAALVDHHIRHFQGNCA